MGLNEENCRKKWTYRNKAQAMHYGVAMMLLPYKCGVCGRWHLTSKGIRQVRANAGLK